MSDRIKLTTNKALQSLHQLHEVESMLLELAKADRFARVTVHSHGVLIQNTIDKLESALELAKQFQIVVQGR